MGGRSRKRRVGAPEGREPRMGRGVNYRARGLFWPRCTRWKFIKEPRPPTRRFGPPVRARGMLAAGGWVPTAFDHRGYCCDHTGLGEGESFFYRRLVWRVPAKGGQGKTEGSWAGMDSRLMNLCPCIRRKPAISNSRACGNVRPASATRSHVGGEQGFGFGWSVPRVIWMKGNDDRWRGRLRSRPETASASGVLFARRHRFESSQRPAWRMVWYDAG